MHTRPYQLAFAGARVVLTTFSRYAEYWNNTGAIKSQLLSDSLILTLHLTPLIANACGKIEVR